MYLTNLYSFFLVLIALLILHIVLKNCEESEEILERVMMYLVPLWTSYRYLCGPSKKYSFLPILLMIALSLAQRTPGNLWRISWKKKAGEEEKNLHEKVPRKEDEERNDGLRRRGTTTDAKAD